MKDDFDKIEEEARMTLMVVFVVVVVLALVVAH